LFDSIENTISFFNKVILLWTIPFKLHNISLSTKFLFISLKKLLSEFKLISIKIEEVLLFDNKIVGFSHIIILFSFIIFGIGKFILLFNNLSSSSFTFFSIKFNKVSLFIILLKSSFFLIKCIIWWTEELL
jgi:hypothetical protein